MRLKASLLIRLKDPWYEKKHTRILTKLLFTLFTLHVEELSNKKVSMFDRKFIALSIYWEDEMAKVNKCFCTLNMRCRESSFDRSWIGSRTDHAYD